MNAVGMPFPLAWENVCCHTTDRAASADETLALQALGMWCARYPYQCFHRSQVIGRIFLAGRGEPFEFSSFEGDGPDSTTS